MVTTPTLFFLDWDKSFHVHVDASSIALGVVLTQPGEGALTTLFPILVGNYLQLKRITQLQRGKA